MPTQQLADANADFARDGVVVLRDVIEPEWLTTLADGIERNRNDLSELAHRYTNEDSTDGYWGDYCNWDRFDEYRRFLFESNAAAHAGAVIGASEIRLFHEHVLVKEPSTAEVTPWHHDLPYYCLQGSLLASSWIPLDPVPQQVCPRFLAGSHLGPMYAPRKFADGSDYYENETGFASFPNDADLDQSARILSWDLQPGDCIVFHMRTLHNAPATTGVPTRRRAFSARWIGEDVVYDSRPGETSPPYPELHATLQPGDALPAATFPALWTSV